MILSNTPLSVSQLRECCAPDHAGSKHTLDDKDDGYEQEQPLKRKPYCRRVPCKARGLSKSHNIDNAYLEIPAGASHGMVLRCSHPECQASGRKFCFCKVCGIPVAKRNFSKRHGHGLLIDCKLEMHAVRSMNATAAATGYGQFSAVPEDQEQSVVSTDDKFPRSVTSESLSAVSAGMLQTRNASTQRNNNPQDGTTVAATAAPVQLSEEENHWLDLLHQRPNLEDQLSMSSWMDQVLELVESPLLREDTSHPLSGTSHSPPHVASNESTTVTMVAPTDDNSMTRGRTRDLSVDLDFETMEQTLDWELS